MKTIPSMDEVRAAQAAEKFDEALGMIRIMNKAEQEFLACAILMKPRHGAGHMEKCFSAMESLVAAGVDVNVRTERLRRTALHYAMENGCRELAAFLIENGADTQAHDELGMTPMMCAARQDKEAALAVAARALEAKPRLVRK